MLNNKFFYSESILIFDFEQLTIKLNFSWYKRKSNKKMLQCLLELTYKSKNSK